MNFELLWIDGLLVSLLWVAALLAMVSRIGRGWFRHIVVGIVFVIPLLILGGFTYAAWLVQSDIGAETNWFPYGLALLAAYGGCAAAILFRGLRSGIGMAGPIASSWRRGPLVFAFLAASAAWYMTLYSMDFAFRARCAILDGKLQSEYVASLPAVTSESKNAAPLYEKVFADLAADEPSDVKNPPIGDATEFDPAEPATLAYLQRHAGDLELLRRAGSMDACRFDADLREPSVTRVLGNLNHVRIAALLLELHAREELAHGHTASAMVDTQAIFQLSRQIGQRPLLVSGLVGIGMDAMGNRTLELALPMVKSADDLSALNLSDLQPLGNMFSHSLLGEEVHGVNMLGTMGDVPGLVEMDYRQVAEQPPPSSLETEADSDGAFFRVFWGDFHSYTGLMDRFQDECEQPYFRAKDDVSGYSAKMRGVFTKILAPSMVRAFETLGIAEAQDECAATAVAMTKYRLEHGTLPIKLEDLTPGYLYSVPIDPFNGQPLKLAVHGDQRVIYSVGPNLVDDGGVDFAPDDKDRLHRLDVIFTVRGIESASNPSKAP